MPFDYKFHLVGEGRAGEVAPLVGVADVTHHVFFEGRKMGHSVGLANVVTREVVSRGW